MVNMRSRSKGNNQGSALLTVILVVAFLTILATTLLYITGMNFQIKQYDYRNQKNFYTGETALEEIRAHLMQDISVAAVQAYDEVNMQYVSLGNKDLRRLQYNTAFVAAIQEEWDAKLAPYGGSWKGLLDSYHTDGELSLDVAYDANGDGILTSAENLFLDENEGLVRIRGIKLKYTNSNGLTTLISTDMEVRAPEIAWSVENTLNGLSGVSAEDAATRKKVDVSNCVIYTDWKKE